MKKYIIQVVFIAIVFCTIYWLFTVIEDLRNENKRLKTNQTALATGNLSNEKTFTQAEFKEYCRNYDSIANSRGIKTKYIEKVINIVEHITDTIYIKNDSNSTEDIHVFSYNDNCLSVFGISYPDSTELRYDYSNEITLFTYWSWRKKSFVKRLFNWDWSKFSSAIAVNKCSLDTIYVNDNIELIKK